MGRRIREGGHPAKQRRRAARSKLRKVGTSVADLREQLDRRTRELDDALQQQVATSEVLRIIRLSPADAQPVFDAIVQSASRLCGAIFGVVYLYDGDRLRIAATNNFTPAATVHLNEMQQLRRPERSHLGGRAILDRKIVHVPDVLEDSEYSHELALAGGWRAVLAVPLLREGIPIGALTAAKAEAAPFSDRQIQLLKTFADQAVIAIENTRLLGELRESLQRQTATSDVLKVISRSTFDLQTVLDTLVEFAVRLCEAERGLLFRRDGEIYKSVAYYNYSREFQEFHESHPITPGRGTAVGRTALEGKAVQIVDLLSDPEYTFTEAQKLGQGRAILAVPLLREANPVGALALQRNEPRAYSGKQIELVETFADQAVIALENARLLNELRKSLQQQTATADVLKVISRSTFDLQTVLDTLLKSAARLCQADHSFIFLREGDVYRCASGSGDIPEWIEYLKQQTIRPGRGTVAARTALEGCTVHIPDVLADPEYTFLEAQRRGGYRTALGVPLLREGIPIGVMVLTRRTVRPFDANQIALVTTFADQAVIAIENVRLFDEVQARTRELSELLEQQTATSEVLKVISSSPGELEPVFEAMLENAVRICSAKFGILFLSEGDTFRTVALHGAPPAYAEARRREPIVRPRPGTALTRASMIKQPVQIADVQAEAAYHSDPSRAGFLDLAGARTVVAVPMLKEDELVGAILIYRQEVRPFSDKQVDILTNFAAQAVIAIENTRLLSELRESLQQQTATADVLKVISRSTFDLQTVLDTLVESAARLCGAEMANIWRPRDGAYRLTASYGVTARYKETLENKEFLNTIAIEPGRGTTVGRVLLERKTVHIHDIQADPDYKLSGLVALGGYRTMLGVPMLREGNPIGVLVLVQSAVRPFTDKQIELATTFADQAVIAIENVRLFEEVQARTRELAQSVDELQALGEVSQAVNSTLELETVLTTIVGRAVQLSRTDTGAIYVFDEERKEFRLHATYGMSEAMITAISGQHIGPGDGNVGTATRQRRPVQVSDIRDEPTSPVNEIILREGYCGILVIPLLRPDHIVGALVVRRKTPGEFPQSTIELLQTFADQSVVAI